MSWSSSIMLEPTHLLSAMRRNTGTIKPWIISSPRDIAQGEIEKKQNIDEYLRTNPFPGTTSSTKSKMEWLQAMNDHYFREIMDFTLEPEDIAAEVLMENAPECIRLDVVVEKEQLQSLDFGGKEEGQRFLKNYQKYIPQHMKYKPSDGSSMDAVKEWLYQNAQISGNRIIFACINCSRNDDCGKKIRELQKDLGMGHCSEFTPLEEEMIGGWLSHHNHEKLGENMYSGYTKDDDPSDPKDGSVHYCIQVEFSIPTAKDLGEIKFSTANKEQEEKFESMGDKRTYFLVQKKDAPSKQSQDHDDDEEENSDEEGERTPLTEQFYEPLWLPASFAEHRTRIQNHFDGEGECANIKTRLKKGNTDSGNISCEIFEHELSYCRKIKNLKERFGAIMALTHVVSTGFNYWIQDNEYYEECAKIFRSLATLWKTSLLKHDDASLGLGLPGEEVGSDGLTHSRKLLYDMMEMYAKELRDFETISSFNWKPALKSSSAAKRKIDSKLKELMDKVNAEKASKKAK